MRSVIHNILSSYKGVISSEMIEKYVTGKATAEEMRHIESMMLDDPFLSDAIEGLKIGDWAQHKAQIVEIESKIVKPQNSIYKMSTVAFAVAASVMLIIYIGFNIDFGMKNSESIISSDDSNIESPISSNSEDAIDTIEVKEHKLIPPTELPPHNELALDKRKEPKQDIQTIESERKESADVKGNYISKDKNSNTRTIELLDEEDADEIAPEEQITINSSTVATRENQRKINSFDLLATNTKNNIFDISLSSQTSMAPKKMSVKPKCENCPDKEEIASKNAIMDTIALHKAENLYNSKDYENAAKWYYRQGDMPHKIMAGVSYLQAADTSSCKRLEGELLSLNSHASEYLKALRLVHKGKENEASEIFQKLIDKNTAFKGLSSQNLKTILAK